MYFIFSKGIHVCVRARGSRRKSISLQKLKKMLYGDDQFDPKFIVTQIVLIQVRILTLYLFFVTLITHVTGKFLFFYCYFQVHQLCLDVSYRNVNFWYQTHFSCCEIFVLITKIKHLLIGRFQLHYTHRKNRRSCTSYLVC